MPQRRLVARNAATESENRIHDDEIARRFGFRGGLVPGVALVAYLVPTVVDDLGDGWLDAGTMSARFMTPVYEGDEVTAACEAGRLTLVTSDGICAEGTAAVGLPEGSEPGPPPGWAPAPRPRPEASRDTLAPGTALASVVHVASAGEIGDYLESIGDDRSWWDERGLVHPGWLLRDANETLVRSVRLGPWIHVGSELTVLGPARLGGEIETRAVVVDAYERKGHQIVLLDVLTTADGEPTLRVAHTAIWRPRQVAEAG